MAVMGDDDSNHSNHNNHGQFSSGVGVRGGVCFCTLVSSLVRVMDPREALLQ